MPLALQTNPPFSNELTATTREFAVLLGDAYVDNDDDHDDEKAIYFFSCQPRAKGTSLLPTILLQKHTLMIVGNLSFPFQN
jgi:hypothetical protein